MKVIKIMKIIRRFPNFFSGFEVTEHEINSKEELMELDWIKSLNEIPNHMGIFYYPNDSKFEPAPDYLMSLTKGESGDVAYFVIGYIFGDGKELGLEDYQNFL